MVGATLFLCRRISPGPHIPTAPTSPRPPVPQDPCCTWRSRAGSPPFGCSPGSSIGGPTSPTRILFFYPIFGEYFLGGRALDGGVSARPPRPLKDACLGRPAGRRVRRVWRRLPPGRHPKGGGSGDAVGRPLDGRRGRVDVLAFVLDARGGGDFHGSPENEAAYYFFTPNGKSAKGFADLAPG